jgi:uncharacterized integral membrane protein
VTFIFLNSDKVLIDYYWGKVNWPSGFSISLGFLIGLFLGRIWGGISGRIVMRRKMLNKFQNVVDSSPNTPTGK